MTEEIKPLQDGDPFYDLESFLLLPDSFLKKHQDPLYQRASGKEWIERYKIAKKSWEQYGTKPPIGSGVLVLVNGHQTKWPHLEELRDILHGGQHSSHCRDLVNEEPEFFRLRKTNPSPYPNNFDISYSLAEKTLWWRTFVVL